MLDKSGHNGGRNRKSTWDSDSSIGSHVKKARGYMTGVFSLCFNCRDNDASECWEVSKWREGRTWKGIKKRIGSNSKACKEGGHVCPFLNGRHVKSN